MAEKKINGVTYQVGVVLATRAIELQLRLLKVIGGGVDRLPAILAGQRADASDTVKDTANAAAVAAFTDVFSKCDPVEVTGLISDLVSLAQIKRPSGVWEQVDLDGDFTTAKGSLIPLVVFVCKEVFGDFFVGLQGAGSRTLQISAVN